MNQPNNEVRARLGARLKFFREKKGLTQAQLAEIMDIQRSTIAKIENGRWGVGIDIIQRFCDALEIEFILEEKTLKIIRK